MTLVYGPNSAGKSTVLKALQMFMQAVDSGPIRRAESLASSVSRCAPQTASSRGTRNPTDVPFSQTRTLTLGVDYRIPSSGDLARAELGFQTSDIGPWQSSTHGAGRRLGPARKEFFLNYEAADPFDRGDFGDIGPKWEVRAWAGGERREPSSGTSTICCSATRTFSCSEPCFGSPASTATSGRTVATRPRSTRRLNLDDIAGPDHWGIAGAPTWGVAGFEGLRGAQPGAAPAGHSTIASNLPSPPTRPGYA